MTALIIILTIILLGVIIVQIGKVNELASKIRGEEVVEQKPNPFAVLDKLKRN